MKVTDIINSRRGKPYASFELVPPLKGTDASKLYSVLEELVKLRPPFINLTCHRDEVEYHPNPDGTYRRLTLSKRPSTLAIVAAIMNRFPDVSIVPHVICSGASRQHIENELLDFNFLGLDNVMALRGDAQSGQKHFIAESDGFEHTDELVAMLSNLNHGVYLDPNISTGLRTDFCIGVAGYPEKHYEAPNRQTDIDHLRRKIDAGADYIVTQMFFDNDHYFRFVDDCFAAGITVPIIPGLKPVSTVKQLTTLPRTFHLDMPMELVSRLSRCTSATDAYRVGTEWCMRQSSELLSAGVPAIHYYTMGRTDNVQQIVREVFGE